MNDKSTAAWSENGSVLTLNACYDDGPMQTIVLRKSDPIKPCHYWCAADGETFGLTSVSMNSCIATVEQALMLAGAKSGVYVTFQYAPHTVSAKSWERWSRKWSKRTADGTT